MNISNTIRTRRRAKDMTQEELAEVLGVSVSAVSQWESDKTMPDIALIPAICSVLEITSDELFGIDLERKKEDIDKIAMEAAKYGNRGYTKEAIEILENGFKRYPDSFDLMYYLMDYYHTLYNDGDEKAKQRVIEYGEKILEKCTDSTTRAGATQLLCFIYQKDDPKRAEQLAYSMGDIWTCREVLRTHIYKGDKNIEASQDMVIIAMELMMQGMRRNFENDAGENRYNRDEMAAVHEKIIAIYHTIFEDGDFGFYHTSLQDSEQPLAIYYAEQQDKEKCLEHLKAAAYHAIEFVKFDKVEEITRTSIVLRGQKEGGFSTTGSDNNALELKDSMKDARYDFVRDTEEFRAILAELDEYAGKWSKKE